MIGKVDREQFMNRVHNMKGRVQYPLHNYESIRKAIGDTITIGTQTFSLDELSKLAESHGGTQGYLPITSESDLENKASKFFEKAMPK